MNKSEVGWREKTRVLLERARKRRQVEADHVEKVNALLTKIDMIDCRIDGMDGFPGPAMTARDRQAFNRLWSKRERLEEQLYSLMHQERE